MGLHLDELELENGQDLVHEKGRGGNHKARMVYLLPETVDVLKAYLEVRPKQNHDLVFCGLKGPLTTTGVYQILKRLAKVAGIEGRYNPHAFRHAFARALLENGENVGTTSQLMGHSDVSVTIRTYGRLYNREMKVKHDRSSWMRNMTLRRQQQDEA